MVYTARASSRGLHCKGKELTALRATGLGQPPCVIAVLGARTKDGNAGQPLGPKSLIMMPSDIYLSFYSLQQLADHLAPISPDAAAQQSAGWYRGVGHVPCSVHNVHHQLRLKAGWPAAGTDVQAGHQ